MKIEELYSRYLEILDHAAVSKSAALLFDDYMSGTPFYRAQEQEQSVTALSEALSASLTAGKLTDDSLADYELAARQAGFYAGFKAATAWAVFVDHYREELRTVGDDGTADQAEGTQARESAK